MGDQRRDLHGTHLCYVLRVTSYALRLTCNASGQHVAEHRVAQLRLEPGAFGRHNPAGIRDGHQVFDTGRKHRKSAGIFAAVHQFFQLGDAANAADEVDALAGARVVDAKQRRQHVFLQEGHVELFDRVARRGEPGAEIQRVPVTVEVKAEFMVAHWLAGTVSLDDKYTIERLEQPRRRHPVQVFQHAVVRENLHLVVWKYHGEEPAAVARALAGLKNSRGRGAAMMAVGDVEARDAG